MPRLGQHPLPDFTIVHLSDTHFLSRGRALFGTVDTDRGLVSALERLQDTGLAPDAFVVTGDIADLGEADAYRRVRSIVESAAGPAPVVWVMGNHDRRAAFAAELFGPDAAIGTQDRVWTIGGLRIIAVDTSVPGYNHGELTPAQLDWLAEVLSTEAPAGTILAMHHPPIPSPVELMGILELLEQDHLAGVLAGSDVRAILAGHLHYSTFSTFAGIPVAVASASCYTLDLRGAPDAYYGVDGAQSFTLVEVYGDRVVHSVMPATSHRTVVEFPREFVAGLAAMSPAARREAFSRQRP